MRFATAITRAGLRLHVRGVSGYVDVGEATGHERLSDLNAVLAGGEEAFDAVRRASAKGGRELSEAEFGPAVPAPARVLCFGVNYLEHALEGGRPPTTWPEVFVRGAGSVATPYGDLIKPALSERFDYEGELALVVGKGGRYIRADNALDALAGYTVLMDGSAREWQRAASQWTPGKNFDATMPIGPEIVTTDEIDVSDVLLDHDPERPGHAVGPDVPDDLQHPGDDRVRLLVYDLEARDVIATGTPGGVGFARQPPVWLQPGDLLEIEIEGLGKLANRVVAEETAVNGWPWVPPLAQKAGF